MASSTVDRYLSPKQVAEHLSVSRSRAYEIVAECQHVKFGRNVRVLAFSFQQWIERHTVAPIAKGLAPPRALEPRALGAKRKHYAPGITGDGSTIRRRPPRT